MKSFPDLSTKGISRHKINHLNISQGLKPPEVAPEELDNLPVPDVVKIVERQVSEYEIIKRQRQLTPQEERERARFLELLLKITIYKLEATAKQKTDTTWMDEAMAKLKRGDYDI